MIVQYRVTGMTCGHCAASVTEEVAEVPGVEQVDVDHETGTMVVQAADVDDEAILAAVTEAGYAGARV